jgi:ribosomal protein L37AE/L43A
MDECPKCHSNNFEICAGDMRECQDCGAAWHPDYRPGEYVESLFPELYEEDNA